MRNLPIGMLSLLAFCTAVLAMQTPPAPAVATVSGVVINQMTGAPIPNVLLTFTSEQGSPATVTTGADGAFQRPLVARRYTIALTHDSFVLTRRSTGPLNLTLAPGQEVENIHYEMLPVSSITGRVLDADGNPMSPVYVSAIQPRYRNGRVLETAAFSILPSALYPRPMQLTAITNEQGEYRLFGLEPGEYYIKAAWDVRSFGAMPTPEYYPGVTAIDDAQRIVVRPGTDQRGIDIRFADREAFTARLRILDVPLPENLFSLVPPNLNDLQHILLVREGRSGVAMEVFSSLDARSLSGFHAVPENEDGNVKLLTIPKLTPGSYRLYYSNHISSPQARISFSIADQDVDVGTLEVRPVFEVHGRVEVPNFSTGFAQFSICPSPVDWWVIYAVRLTGSATERGCWRLDSNGAFVLEGMHEGEIYVNLRGLPADVYVAAMTYGGRELVDGVVTMDGPPSGPLVIELDRPGGIVEGVVRDTAGDPVGDAQVVLIPTLSRRTDPNRYKTAATDQFGVFSMRGVAPGDYTVLAWEYVEPGAYMNAEFLSGVESRGEHITVQNGIQTQTTVRVIPDTVP